MIVVDVEGAPLTRRMVTSAARLAWTDGTPAVELRLTPAAEEFLSEEMRRAQTPMSVEGPMHLESLSTPFGRLMLREHFEDCASLVDADGDEVVRIVGYKEDR